MTSQNRNRDNRDRGIPPSALAFLRQLEALSDVRAGLPITSHRPGPTGLALIFAKKLFRRASQVFINELMRKQQQFNDIAIELFYVVYRDIQSLEGATLAMRAGLQERIRDLETAVKRLELQQVRQVESTGTTTLLSPASTKKN